MKLNEAAAKSAFLEFPRNIHTKSHRSFWYRVYDSVVDDPDRIQIASSDDPDDPDGQESRI